tara:strand:- start:115 stop:372 length:258 start_codon:yes stop_codon:yes gene_type:complete
MEKSKIEILREKYDFQESKLNNSEFLKIYWRMKKDLNDNEFLLNIPLDKLGSYKHQTQKYTICNLDDISFVNTEVYKYYSHDNCR